MHAEGDVRPRIAIFDTTLRDGEQAPGFSMREAEKVRLAVKLDELGVDILEAGFPIASEDDFSGVRAVAKAVRRPVVAALARAVDADVDRALQALDGCARPRLHTFI
ncbi:MAG TPA: 2-isopropylmalate synthase, partial [Thermoanaerobaculia bacterium]|nr:2-isopropylmalate synthase [Thermoanaerobaculia bacterium]